MSFTRNALSALVTGAVALSLTACGSNALGPVVAKRVNTSTVESSAVPPQSAFTTITGKVTEIMPEDNQGLPHQNFFIQDSKGRKMAVNNNTHHGSKVPNLKVGDELTIRGVEYHNKAKDGIHWTHKANKPGDAGWIQTANGTKYE